MDKNDIRQRLMSAANVANGGDGNVAISAKELLSIYEQLWTAQTQLHHANLDNIQLRGMLAANNVDEYTLECLKLAQGARDFFSQEMYKAQALIAKSHQQPEVWFKAVSPDSDPGNGCLIRSIKGDGDVGPFYERPYIPNDIEWELELHRADYNAIKAAGFESPGELLSAYTYLLSQASPSINDDNSVTTSA